MKRYEYALVRKSNGHLRSAPVPTPWWLQLLLRRDEKLARRYDLKRRELVPGEWEDYDGD